MNMKKNTVLLLSLLLTVGYLSNAQEFVILNDVVEFTMDSPHGYYFFDPDGTMPSNWASPYDYYNGQIYTRYEIISEATDETSYVQFGIWQDHVGTPPPDCEVSWTEQMAEPMRMDGPGSVQYNNSSPTTWWAICERLDFSRVDKFWRLGIILWENTRSYIIADDNWGGTDELWQRRDTWFPMEVYCIVVAVAEGETFSGWENYIGYDPGGEKPPTPSYTINYAMERTNQVVPSTDEYSYYSNMTDAVSGNGGYLTINPGQDVYFRTKAEGVNPASDIQHLTVSGRPSAPVFAIDFTNERTSATVSSEYEYANASDMSSATTGTGNYVDIVPGTAKYFRKRSTASAFTSVVQALSAPARPAAPAYTIDFVNIRTSEAVPSSQLYSVNQDMSGAASGTGAALDLTPGTDMYFKIKPTASAFASAVAHLTVPEKPEILSQVGDTVETEYFTVDLDFHGSSDGFTLSDLDVVNATLEDLGGLEIKVIPVALGDVELEIKANALTNGNFASDPLTTYNKVTATETNDFTGQDIDLAFFPNPAGDILTLRSKTDLNFPLGLRLLDGNGTLILHRTIENPDEVIDIGEIAPGLYIYQIYGKEGTISTGKLMKL